MHWHIRTLPLLLLALPLFAREVRVSVVGPENATVTAHRVESSAEQQARWTKRGTRPELSLDNLPEAVVDVVARADGFAPAAVRVIPGQNEVTITLRPAPVVEGRITSEGKPLPNATIVWTGINDVEHVSESDAAGRYRAPDPRMWSREPIVLHPSLAQPARGFHGANPTHLEVREMRRPRRASPPATGTISGVVRVGDKPLAGAPVVLQPMADEPVEAVRVVTDEKGRYRAERLLPYRTMVLPGEGLEPRLRSAHHPRMYEEGREPSVADLTAAREATVDLELVATPLLSGRVTDAEGAPVAGARVQVILAQRPAADFAHEPFARTSADGRFELAMPPFDANESAVVVVSLPLHSTVRSKPFAVGTESRRLDVTLPRFEEVVIRVIDGEGAPIPRARIAFAAPEEVPLHRGAAMLLVPGFPGSAAVNAPSGETTLHLVPGVYTFAAVAEGFQTRTVTEQAVARGSRVDIALEPAFTIRGRVHREGTGVSGVQVMVFGDDVAMRAREPITTGADGRFEIGGLARATYRLSLQKHEEMLQREITTEAPAELDVALPAAGTLQGRVVDAATRQAVPQFVFSVEPVEPSDAQRRDGVPMMQRGESAGDGTFRATLSAGRYRVTAGAIGFTMSDPVEVLVTAGEIAQIDIALERGLTITGRVVDDHGAPVANVTVFAYGEESSPDARRSRARPRVAPGNTNTAEDGSFTITGLEPGAISITARREGFVPWRKSMTVEQSTDVEIRLDRGAQIEGVVTRAGRPVAGAHVSATTAAIGGDHQSTVSGDDGRFVLRGLVAAKYTAAASTENSHGEVKNVDPTTQREVRISLDPKAGGVLHGAVMGMPANLGGKIIRRVVLVQSDERGVEAAIGQGGNYRVENAPAGPVWVTAQVESGSASRSSERRRVTIPAGQEVRLDLDLGGDVTVTGRASFSGRPVGGARIVVVNDAGVAASATTRDDGAYELTLAAPGTYRIFAHADGVTSAQFQAVRELRGREVLDIEFREQIVEGVVVDATTRQPLASAVVTVAPDARVIDHIAGEVVSDAGGRFRIITGATGAHRLIVWAPGYAPVVQPITLSGASIPPLQIEMRGVERLHVRVTDARTGLPLEAHLTVETTDGMSIPVRPSRTPDGAWDLWLAPGQYGITANVHGYEIRKVVVTAPGVADIRM